MSKFFVYCSCIICKKQTTTMHIDRHVKAHEAKAKVKAYCGCCGDPIFKSNQKFCDHKCAASVTNITRGYVKTGPPPGTVAGISKPHNGYKRMCHIDWCTVCKKLFENPDHRRKTCSKDCQMTIIQINRGGRYRKSYMESSFTDWLEKHNVSFEAEVKIINPETNTYYFVDFLFRDKNLIIELDGKQHLNMIEADAKRDEFMNSIGYTVVRISQDEYKKKTRIEEISALLF